MACLSACKTFGGFPFLDVGFSPRVLLAAVAARRAWALGARSAADLRVDARLLLCPRVARETFASLPGPVVNSTRLSQARLTAIDRATARILRRVPSWIPLLRALPIEYRLLQTTDAISASSFHWPQHVFLAPCAFASERELAEQVLHEMCHNWTYLVEEVAPLTHVGRERRFVLPSGTPDRDLSEVLGAATVASVLIRWYGGSRSAMAGTRSASLRTYLGGCLKLITGAERDALTSVGVELLDRVSMDAD